METCLDALHLTESYADDPHLIKVYFGELHLTTVLPWWTVSHKCPHLGSLLWWTAPYKKLFWQSASCRGMPQWLTPGRVLPWWTVSRTGMVPDPRHLGEPPGPGHAHSPSPAAAPLALASTALAQSSSSPWCAGCSPQTRRAGPARWAIAAAGHRPCSAPPGCHDAAVGTAGAGCSHAWETTAHRTHSKNVCVWACMHVCVCWGGGGMGVCNNDWFLSGYSFSA